MGSSGIGACNLFPGAWGRGCLGTGLVGVGAGVLAVIFRTLGSVTGGDGCLGCV